MSYDIGPKIGIDGEAEFRKAIGSITQNIRTLSTEMKAVTSVYDSNDKSLENLTAQNEVLEKQISAQKEKLAMLTDGLKKSVELYGENDIKTQKWAATVNMATADLNKMERQLKKNESAIEDLGHADFSEVFDGADELADALQKLVDEAEDGADAMENLDDAAKKPGKSFDALKVAAGNLLSSGIQKIVSGIGQAVSALVNLDEATEEYRVAQGKLQTAFETAGYGPEAAKEAYTEFYKILGDTDTAAEASQLLAKLAQDEEDIAKWTEIAAGVYGTFGDALPIEGLIEACNETAKVGQVTGNLADALNWAKISEDEFNQKLAACNSEGERNRLIMETLSGTYDEASDAFYRNNEELVRARENQTELDEVTGRLGETVSSVKNELLEKFGPAIVEIGDGIADFIEGIDTEKLFGKFDAAWTSIKGVWDDASPYFDAVWNYIKGTFGVAKDVLTGDFAGAWEGIKGVFAGVYGFFEDVGRKVIQGIENGMSDVRSTKYGEFGGDTERGGSFGGGSNGSSTAQSGFVGGDVYLDGRKVGRVLAGRQNDDAKAQPMLA